MMIASACASAAGRVVTWIRSVTACRRSDSMSSMYDSPRLIASILRVSTSTATTSCPASAKATARGRPTYPSPTIPMLMTRASVDSVWRPVSVPLFDTKTPLAPLRAQIDAAIAGVVGDGHFILGPNVQAFEAEFAAYCGVAHAVGVANGTDAITIALK